MSGRCRSPMALGPVVSLTQGLGRFRCASLLCQEHAQSDDEGGDDQAFGVVLARPAALPVRENATWSSESSTVTATAASGDDAVGESSDRGVGRALQQLVGGEFAESPALD